MIRQLSPTNKRIDVRDVELFRDKHLFLDPFDSRVVNFLNELSGSILRDPLLKRHPEMAALGFWLRKSNIKKMIDENSHLINNSRYEVAPLGVVFHVCPSNIDTMFIYSLCLALLMGNKNIVRISRKVDIPRIRKLIQLINSLSSEADFRFLKRYLSIVSYDHQEENNAFLSSNCDARILWGGNETIGAFKKYQTPLHARDIVFADRISLSLFKVEAYSALSDDQKTELTRTFFNDSFTFDQMACSSPHYIYIMGVTQKIEAFKADFFPRIKQWIQRKYDQETFSMASLKINQLAEDAIEDRIVSYSGDSSFLVAQTDPALDDDLPKSCGGGYFYQQSIADVSELSKVFTKKIQTISYFGIDESEVQELLTRSKGRGIDRIVPIGEALHFNYIWDGYNLFEQLSSKKYVSF